jgi:hypothetical protein
MKLNKGHYHEAMDRCYVEADNIQRNLLDHPVFIKGKNIKLRNKLEEALGMILEVYQEVGLKA